MDGVRSREDSQKTWLLGLFSNVGDLVMLLVDVNLQKNLSAHHMGFYSTEGKAQICCPVSETWVK